MNYRISADTMKSLQKAQKNEITEYHIYSRLSSYIKNEYNSNILKQIAMDEHHHYNVLKTFTGTDKKPNSLKILFYTLISLIFGITFGIKLMERGEKSSENLYRELGENIDEFKRIADE